MDGGNSFDGCLGLSAHRRPVMLTRPRPWPLRAEAKTHEAEARFFGLEAEAKFEAKFMRRQRFEKPKNL